MNSVIVLCSTRNANAPISGGALIVRHEGNQLVYDWSSTNPFEIGWAAFYSDCEHEVEQMQSGHRITLAYNLYVTDRVGWTLQQPNPSVDPSQMVLYEMLKDMLVAPAFLSSGKANHNHFPLWQAHQFLGAPQNIQRSDCPSHLQANECARWGSWSVLLPQICSHQ